MSNMENKGSKISRFLQIPGVADAIIILVLMLATAYTASETLMTGEPLRPGIDSYYLDFPFRTLAWESVTNGEWPLWNPYNSGGTNLLGQPFNFLIYPLYDLVYLFDKGKIFFILGLVQVFHLFLGLTGMYFLLKKLVGYRLIALWGAFSYGFSYPVVTAFKVGQLLVSFTYLPWIVLFLYTIKSRTMPVNIAGLSLLIFLMVAGGFPQWTLYVLALVFLFVVSRYNPLYKKTRRIYLLGIFLFFTAGLLAFFIGAIEFIPFIEQNAHGARGNIASNVVSTQQKWQMPFLLTMRLFIPDIFNSNFRAFFPNPMVFEGDNFISFFGISAVLLAISGIFMTRRRWLRNWKLITLLVFFVALGTPFLTDIISLLTLKADLVHTRMGVFLPFVGVILAAGMMREALLKKQVMTTLLLIFTAFAVLLVLLSLLLVSDLPDEKRQSSKITDNVRSLQIQPDEQEERYLQERKTLYEIRQNITAKIFGWRLDEATAKYMQKKVSIGAAFVMAYLVLFFLHSKRYIGHQKLLLFLCMLAFIEMRVTSLHIFSPHFSIRPTHEYFERSRGERLLDDLLAEEKNRYRVNNTITVFEPLARNLGGPYMHYFPDANIFNRFYELNAYLLNMQKDVGQTILLQPGGYFIRMGAWNILLAGSRPNLFSTKYVVAPEELDLGKALYPFKEYRTIDTFTEGPPDDRHRLKIVEIEDVPPRFFFPSKVIGGLERGKIFEHIRDPLFDPRNVTYFEDDILETNFDISKQKVLKVSVPTPNRVTVSVSSEKPGILVANNFWHKWWKVKVNGVPGKVYRVNYNFQAVKVPAGESSVEFYCVAESLEYSKYLSLLGVISISCLFAVGRRRHSKTAAKAG